MRRLAGWWLPGWLLAWAVWLGVAAAPARAQTRFEFAAIGGLPAGSSDERDLVRELSALDQSAAAFIVHLGGFKTPAEPCADALYAQRRALLDAAARPLIAVPGTADWLDCDGQGHDPAERLGRLRELFFGDDSSLGQERLRLSRESELARFRGYPENVRWRVGQVMFVGLNLPGRNNDFRSAAGRNAEFDDRLQANKLWLERAFQQARRERLAALVIALHGDPRFEVVARRGGERDGYAEFKDWLRQQCAGFTGPVLLLHGAVPRQRVDQPLRTPRATVVGNLTRLAVADGGTARVRVNTAPAAVRAGRVWQVERAPARRP